MNTHLHEEILDWVQPMMWLILNKYYPIYEKGIGGKKYTIVPPLRVTEFGKNNNMFNIVFDSIKNLFDIETYS